jgi:hypothetical protein
MDEREHTVDILVTIDEKALNEQERANFLAFFPRQRGAHVADILDLLDQHDTFCGPMERVHESLRAEASGPLGELFRPAFYLAVFLNHEGRAERITPESVKAWMERLGAVCG